MQKVTAAERAAAEASKTNIMSKIDQGRILLQRAANEAQRHEGMEGISDQLLDLVIAAKQLLEMVKETPAIPSA